MIAAMTTLAEAPARSHPAVEEAIGLAREAATLGSTASILGWDQETMMPAGGLEHRARQLAQLARLAHGMSTDPRLGDALSRAAEATQALPETHADRVNVRELRRAPDPEEDVGLVLRPVEPALDAWSFGRLRHARVVAGRDRVAAELLRVLPELPELEPVVAAHARVRRAARVVLLLEVGDDPAEVVPEVHDVEGDREPLPRRVARRPRR